MKKDKALGNHTLKALN